MSYLASLVAGDTRKTRNVSYVYDPKYDVKIVFRDEMKRTDVIAWLLKCGIHKHSLSGVLYLRQKEYEVELSSEEALNHLVKKCDSFLGEFISDYKKAKPLETKVTISLVPGSFPDQLITTRLEAKVGPIQRKSIEKEEDICTGRRFYYITTSDIEVKPIPDKITIAGRTMWVKYPNQPVMCYNCKEFGHMSAECPKKKEENKDERKKEDMTAAFERKDDDKKRTREKSSTGDTPDPKRTVPSVHLYDIDPSNEHDVNWKRAIDTELPLGGTPLRQAGLKECEICQQNLVIGHSDKDIIIGRCTCNNMTRENVLVKCSQEECESWYQFPKKLGERVICN